MIDLYIFILEPILIATLFYLFPRGNTKLAFIGFQGILLALSIKNFIYVRNNGTIIQNLGSWNANIGIALRADLLSTILVTLTLFLFLAMLIFSYDKHYINSLFLFLFLILQSLIIGILFSEDLFNLYVLLEVSTMVVSVLIMFKKDKRSIYDGMLYLLVNIAAMTFFLFGIGYLYKMFGVLNIYSINEKMYLIENKKSLILPYALMITAVGLKSALMPLFSWLPKAHGTPSAPSIVSAILSGLYVKTGIYLFIRVQFMFSPVLDTSQLFLIMGLLTGIAGFFLAICQSDIKLILAYSTVSQIGLIMIGLTLGEGYVYWGAIYHMINHAIFKSTLFLTAGLIIEEYNTRDIYKIKGVFKRMPFVSIAAILAILGITGAPLFNGSISKYLIQSATKGTYMEYAILLVNFGTIAYFIKYSSIFYSKKEETNFPIKFRRNKNINLNRTIVVLFLGMVCFLGGVFGEKIIYILFNQKIHITLQSYLHKAEVYLLTLIAGFFFYKFVILKWKFLHKVREIELSFNGICISVISFFFFMLTILTFA
ncbi:complex I subunit 5 family protein [Clostridium grantii]|uniref:Multisubunit sodium/proton antiporter, MrpD subunit n=1 Tax=Clostridium grantii DSM 8605 TaxID=1121316 RepID=A0A1M5RLR6_9CLOT|nr:proton-conducting transporter membrane subunit [Clostridium grantii]SHH27262.1 multisubunit sodium/proton antiporter, MrpD subunit [Clostridium grantii DSM 8605]